MRIRDLCKWMCFLMLPITLLAAIFTIKFEEYNCGYERPIYYCNATLIKRDIYYKPTSAHPQQITIWDCAEYGIIASNDDHLFRLSKQNLKLKLIDMGNDNIKIIGMEKE